MDAVWILLLQSIHLLTGQQYQQPSDTMTTMISRSNSPLTSIKMIALLVLMMLLMSIIFVVVEGFTTIPSFSASSPFSSSSSSSSSSSNLLLMVSTASTGRSRPTPTRSTRLYVDIPSPREKIIPIIITDDDDDDDDEDDESSYQQPVVDTIAPAPAHAGTTHSLPWSDVQDWALRDNIPKYLFRIQTTTSDDEKKNGAGGTATATTTATTLTSYCQWRSLLQDVPELAGYPVDFLQLKYQEQQQKQQRKKDVGDVPVIGILPYLQDYEFTTQGGVVGTVYGLEGVAEGSRMETSALKGVQETLPLGYIQTTEGIAFEVGRPMSKMLDDGRANDANAPWRILSNSRAAVAASSAASSSSAVVSGLQSATQQGAKQLASSSELQSTDELLVRLGATTGILLAGATAINMISHHMTVNVFWV